MAHGTPDWGAAKPTTTVYSLGDMAELAARMGSINTFDRRGDTVWMDDFEDNINKWLVSAGGVGAAAELSAAKARNGGKSCLMTTGNSTGDITYLTRYIGTPDIYQTIGLEASFILKPTVAFRTKIQLNRAGVKYEATLKCDPAANTLSYFNAAYAWTDLITDLDLEEAYAWHTLKIVIDSTVTGVFSRVMLDNLTPDVAGLAIPQSAEAAADSLSVLIIATALTDANSTMYVDDVIVTQNEP